MRFYELYEQAILETTFDLFEGPREDWIIANMGRALSKSLDDESYVETVDELVEMLSDMDPTKNKQYLQWITKQYLSTDISLTDTDQVHEVISLFDKFKARLPVKDINRLNYGELETLTSQIKSGESTGVFSDKYDGIEGAEVLYSGPLGLLASPSTESASCELGRGTRWCTAGKHKNLFNRYNNSGKLYVWIDRTGTKYQFHWNGLAGGFEFMDSKDRDLSSEDVFAIKNENPVLRKFFAMKEKEYMEDMIKNGTIEHLIIYDKFANTNLYDQASEIINNKTKSGNDH